MEELDCYSNGMFKLVPRLHKCFTVLILCWNVLSCLAMKWLYSYLHGLGRLTDWYTSNPRYTDTTGSEVHRTVTEPKGCERKLFSFLGLEISLLLRTCCTDLASATKLFVRFLWNSVYMKTKMQPFEFRTIGSVTLLKDASDLSKVQYRSSLHKYEFRENRFSEKHTLLKVVTKFRPIFYIPCPIRTKFGTNMFIKKW
jgi:hypothetical protein